ncbi:type IV secretion system protein [Orbus wheelerorum]|uniref:virB8 family protein n=1 Tax=Orbus wheelerorum TaxID=3074111 RepID=UPI00370D6DC7
MIKIIKIKQENQKQRKNKEKDVFSSAREFEEDKEYLFKRSEKRAWTVAISAIFLLIISWIILLCLLPLKEVTPYVIQVNEKTGIPDVITVTTPIDIRASEALDKYFVNTYIQDRESYTYQTIQQNYTLTQLYSDDKVKAGYLALMNAENAPDRAMKKGTIAVKVNSIILDDVNATSIATARIVKTYTTERNEIYTKHFVIKMAFEYLPKQKIQLSYRLDNPLGFQVISYQIVEENI